MPSLFRPLLSHRSSLLSSEFSVAVLRCFAPGPRMVRTLGSRSHSFDFFCRRNGAQIVYPALQGESFHTSSKAAINPRLPSVEIVSLPCRATRAFSLVQASCASFLRSHSTKRRSINSRWPSRRCRRRTGNAPLHYAHQPNAHVHTSLFKCDRVVKSAPCQAATVWSAA